MARLSDQVNLSNELKQYPISDLIEKAKSLVRARGYSQGTIWHYNGRFNDLRRHAAIFSTEKLSKTFIARYVEEGAYRSSRLTSSNVQRKSLLNLLATAVNTAPVFTYENDSDNIRNRTLRENLIAYEQHLRGQEKSNNTIKSYLKTATSLLFYLNKNKKYNLFKVSAIDVRDFIIELGVKWSPRSMQIVPSQLKTYLKFAGAAVDAVLASNFHIPRKSKPVRAMSNENVESLWKYLDGDAGDLRSKAIITILLATGMRPVDVTGLKLDDINWNNDTISFIQSKTDEGMTVKLFPVIGSAIVRYITAQRPKGTGQQFVFLSKRAPYRKLSPSTCNRILKEVLEEIGVSFVADGLHCPRAIRRSLVSRMIAKGIPVQKAAASIGHVDEKSVDLYTELDVEKMKSICLPIPNSMKGWCVINE
jgi:site-specific recombinase XerD